MLTSLELRRIARARLQDAVVLVDGRRYDGAVYLCGYAVELALKARICTTLRWAGFPETTKEFANLQTFKTHDLELLLRLTGREARIRPACLADWSVVVAWGPEARYRRPGAVTRADARSMVEATRRLLRVI